MDLPKPSEKDLLASCSEVGPDDGLDPRKFLREPRPRVKNRKALQMCAQVAETLTLVLGGDSGDAVLRELLVTSVTPAPDSSRLLVTVVPTSDALEPDAALEHLQRAAGRLRSEVAASIHRRRTPLLTFRVASQ